MNLETKFDGLVLKNPLMPASGPLVGDLEKLNFMLDQGVGAVVTKTISTTAARVPRPCIYGGKDYVMNCELWSEYSKEKWLEEFLPGFDRNTGTPLIISVGYTKEDMEILIPLLDPFADAFEVSTHYVGKDLSKISETVKTIRKHTEKPVYMKISPHIPEPVLFAEAVRDAGASGLAAINSLGPTMKIDLKKRAIVYGNDSGFAWTSGPAIKNLALATVYTIKKALPDFTVIGVGGVQSADDVIEFLMAGASGVQMLSAAMLKGKNLYSKIIKDLPNALEKYGFESVEEVMECGLQQKTRYAPKLPQVDLDKCTACRLCERICPYFAITYEGRITFNEEKCFGCELCLSKCPVGAIY
ncbi:4Fe-4S binding protein [Vallitalea okinawensis]|uniref:4Fe-4S binding protein n=1 Tax=Vallitalea okinawensis TaxID=2078660 RepID=UPI000CFC9AFE|nr:4Fe-4S binding protein [Vallitalea okinawensis]